MTPSRLFIAVTTLLGLSTLAFANTINSGSTILVTSGSTPGSIISTTVQNVGGTYSNPGGGLQLSNATLSFLSGVGDVSGDATALNFSIGAPTSGSIASGFATWTSAVASTFSFSDPTASLTFTGSFSCSALQPCFFSGTPSGFAFAPGWITGLLNGKPTLVALTVQNSLTTAAVPEVGTLGMVGMGLLGFAVLTKRKFFGVARRLRTI